MADAPPERALRLFLDATILIKAVSFPRLPFEVVRLGLRGEARIVLSPLVVASARLHVGRLYPHQLPLFERVLAQLDYEEVADPEAQRIALQRGLCRDESDVPVVLAAVDGGVDYLVTNDRDLTVVDASTARLRDLVTVITPLALLRHVLGWPEDRIEAAIHRQWHELRAEDRHGLES
jgi:predicted nucleic acid-binding protein